ncbi:MAG TPA: HEAT repeat domain-containing protein [Myxococcota bacterium]|nr:HEAT repeat domain-containing protein [Myxococcota bacterium]
MSGYGLAVPVDPAVEEETHARVVALSPQDHEALAQLYHGLGDLSWRVRKAALVTLQRFRAVPKLVETLIGGLGSQDNAGLRNACAEGLVFLGDTAVEELGRALYTADLDQRKFVVEVLGLIGTRPALESLLGALDQADTNVKSAVVDALGQIGGPIVTAELTRRLAEKPDDLQYAVYVLDALGRCRACLPVASLLPWLGQKQLARFVYPLLGLCQDVAALAPLVQAVVTGSRGVRRMAMPALVTLWRSLDARADATVSALLGQHPNAVDVLVDSLGDEDGIAEAAVRLLSLCNATAHAAKVLDMCAARGMAQVGIESMSRLGPAVVVPLIEAMETTDVQAQLLFLDVIESVGDASAVPALLRICYSAHPHLAAAAVRAVGKLAGADVVGPLMQVVRTRDEAELSRQAVFALARIGERHPDVVASHMRRALEVGDVQPAWLSVLGSVRRSQDIDVLVASCKHMNPEVRRAAVEAAQRFGSQIPETCMLEALRDEHPRVRVAAARALSTYGSEASLQALLGVMTDLDPWVVAEAARSLGAVGGRKATHVLHLAASSSSAPIAIAALQSLARLGSDGLESTVRRALQHAEVEVVREALAGAVRIGGKLAQEALEGALSHRSWDVRWAAAEALLDTRLPVPLNVINAASERETEPLVRERLERLRTSLGGFR